MYYFLLYYVVGWALRVIKHPKVQAQQHCHLRSDKWHCYVWQVQFDIFSPFFFYHLIRLKMYSIKCIHCLREGYINTCRNHLPNWGRDVGCTQTYKLTARFIISSGVNARMYVCVCTFVWVCVCLCKCLCVCVRTFSFKHARFRQTDRPAENSSPHPLAPSQTQRNTHTHTSLTQTHKTILLPCQFSE